MKKPVLKILEYSQENPALESFLNKVVGLLASNFSKKRLQIRCFAVNIAKFLRTSILKNICQSLLLFTRKQSMPESLFQ